MSDQPTDQVTSPATPGWLPHVTVACVVEQAGRFLLVEEHTLGRDALVFNQPAGHVEAGETLIDAAIRETHEETGWHVTPTALLGLYTYTPPQDPDCTYYRVCFLATPEVHDELAILDQGIEQAVWLTLEELIASGRARSPLVARCIEDAQRGQQFPLSLICEDFLFASRPDRL